MGTLGDFASGCTIFDIFTTTDTSGRPTLLAGNPPISLVAYRNAFLNSCSTAGLTLSINCNGLLGVQGWSVNTNSDPAFYACGSQYQVLLRGGCVDSICVSGYVVGRFSLNAGSSLRPLIHGCNRVATTPTGAVRINWAEIENKTAVEALSCTSIFAVTSLTNGVIVTGYGVGANPGTEQGIACTIWNSLQANYDVCGSFGTLLDCRPSSALHPTTPGRKLDVTATGAAGIDWGNVENPATANALSCTSTFSVHSVDNAVKADDCSTIFSVVKVLDPSNIGTGSAPTEGAIACTVWNQLKASYGTCGTFGDLLDCKVSTRLGPTVPGRPLDVTATGAAGIDWGNVENKATANDLDCTTLFKVHSVDNAIRADSCSTIFSVQSLLNGVTVTGYAVGCEPLRPTVAGRTLDITATGAAGVDWGNVENKATANDLDCTTTFSVRSVLNAVTAAPCSAIYSVETLSNSAVQKILTGTIPEPTGVFAWASATLGNILGWLGAMSSNCVRQTVTLQTLRDRADSTALATAALTCEATVVQRGSFT